MIRERPVRTGADVRHLIRIAVTDVQNQEPVAPDFDRLQPKATDVQCGRKRCGGGGVPPQCSEF